MQFDFYSPLGGMFSYDGSSEHEDEPVPPDILNDIMESTKTVDDKTFHIPEKGNEYETIVCLKCYGKHFYVARGNYVTAIKCVNCLWEKIEHSG